MFGSFVSSSSSLCFLWTLVVVLLLPHAALAFENETGSEFEILTPSSFVNATERNLNTSIFARTLNLTGIIFNDESSYTLFAPNNSAFAELPIPVQRYTISKWLIHIRYLLLSNIANGSFNTTELASKDSIVVSTGLKGTIRTDAGGTVFVGDNNAEILFSGDFVEGNNSIVHVTNKYLVPPVLTLDIYEQLKRQSNFSRLVGMIDFAGLRNTLSDASGRFTLFCPTNAAIEAADSILTGLTAPQIREILLYHVIGSNIYMSIFTADRAYSLPTLNTGLSLVTGKINATDGGETAYIINDATLLQRYTQGLAGE